MQGDDNKGAEYQPFPQPGEYRRTNPANPAPILRCSANLQPVEQDRYSGGGGVKRGHAEPEENSNHEKWRKRGGVQEEITR